MFEYLHVALTPESLPELTKYEEGGWSVFSMGWSPSEHQWAVVLRRKKA